VKSRAPLRAGIAVLFLAALLTTACTLDPKNPEVSIDVRAWYPSQEILIPFQVQGGDLRFAEYRYEYDAGDGWVVDVERTIRVPESGGGLIELSVANPDWNHRLTFSALSQPGPGQPLEPFLTVERYFHIDATAPSVERGNLILRVFVNDSLVPLPEPLPDFYNPALRLEAVIDHAEFAAPSGSPVRIYVTQDGSIPRDEEWSESIDAPRRVEIWPGGGGPYFEQYRFMVVDEAGNRSGVRSVVFQSL
jgi:hypothetical protein